RIVSAGTTSRWPRWTPRISGSAASWGSPRCRGPDRRSKPSSRASWARSSRRSRARCSSAKSNICEALPRGVPMTGPRREKVSDLIREEVARLIQSEMHDNRLGFVTVTEVRMSPDLKHARIYVSLLAEGTARDQAMEALGAARGFIRRRIGQTLRLKHTPDLQFSLDTSMEYGARI